MEKKTLCSNVAQALNVAVSKTSWYGGNRPALWCLHPLAFSHIKKTIYSIAHQVMTISTPTPDSLWERERERGVKTFVNTHTSCNTRPSNKDKNLVFIFTKWNGNIQLLFTHQQKVLTAKSFPLLCTRWALDRDKISLHP